MHWFDRFAVHAARAKVSGAGGQEPARASRRGFLTKVAAVGGGAAATAAVLPLERAGATTPTDCSPNILCGTICVNPSKDQDNCGACGNFCGPGELCSLGKCCPCGSVNCGGVCTDVWHDPANCGRCGHHCRHGQVCKSGKCTTATGPTCSTANDCGTSTACVTYQCTGGVCGSTFAASGVVVAGQTAGDCRINVCDGAGNVVMQVDNTDPPASTACATGTCAGGSPGFTYTAAGTACAGGTCDGQGVCVSSGGCSIASDCGTNTECVTFTCTQGVCGSSSAPAGTVVTTQTAQDCHQNVCDGTGNIVSHIDDTDVPIGGGPCVIGVCTAGTPSFPPLPAGSPCRERRLRRRGHLRGLPHRGRLPPDGQRVQLLDLQPRGVRGRRSRRGHELQRRHLRRRRHLRPHLIH